MTSRIALKPRRDPCLWIRQSVAAGATAEFIAEVLADVRARIRKQHAVAAGTPFALIHRSDLPRSRLEVGWPVVTPVAGTKRIHAGALPRSRLAPTMHPSADV